MFHRLLLGTGGIKNRFLIGVVALGKFDLTLTLRAQHIKGFTTGRTLNEFWPPPQANIAIVPATCRLS